MLHPLSDRHDIIPYDTIEWVVQFSETFHLAFDDMIFWYWKLCHCDPLRMETRGGLRGSIVVIPRGKLSRDVPYLAQQRTSYPVQNDN